MVNQQTIAKIRDFIYETSGICVNLERDIILDRKVRSRMEKLQFDNFNDYYRYLIFEHDPDELSGLINVVTVNETFFFRNYYQLSGFAEQVLPDLTDEKQTTGDKTLRILSAGCSSGEEPYTLSIILREILDDFEDWHVDINAFDINNLVLEKAMAGSYDDRSTRDIPVSYKVRYFNRENGAFTLRDEIRNAVRFNRGNIMDEKFVTGYAGLDVVFCRNVLIYFDDVARKRVLNMLYHCLKPGGFIFLGYSETVSRLTGAFELVKYDNDFMAYRKPLLPKVNSDPGSSKTY